MSSDLGEAVRAVLEAVKNPRTGAGLVTSGMISDLAVDPATREASFVFLLKREDPATLVRQARQALAAADFPQPKIKVVNPAGPAPTTHGAPQSAQAAVPAPTPMEVPGIAKVIAISSGKGGVGKSTVAVNVAVALAERGFRIGIMDADFYGPNLPRMIGVTGRPMVQDGRIFPLEAFGVKLMSIGFLVDRDGFIVSSHAGFDPRKTGPLEAAIEARLKP